MEDVMGMGILDGSHATVSVIHWAWVAMAYMV